VGQPDGDGGAEARHRDDLERAAGALGELAAQRQPDAAAGPLGREEQLGAALVDVGRHALAGVGHRQLELAIVAAGVDADRVARPAGLERVDREVEDDRRDHRRHEGQRLDRLDRRPQVDAARLGADPEDRDRLAHGLVDGVATVAVDASGRSRSRPRGPGACAGSRPAPPGAARAPPDRSAPRS
jgi:hypothetical protein